MKTEIRDNAREHAISTLTASIPNLIPARVGNHNVYVMETPIRDEETDTPVYALFSVSIPSTTDTKTTEAFKLEEAIANLVEWQNKPKKERKTTEKVLTPEEIARKEEREKLMNVIENWLVANLGDRSLTTTEIAGAIPECAGVPLMNVGTLLKKISERNLRLERNVVKGKPYYSMN